MKLSIDIPKSQYYQAFVLLKLKFCMTKSCKYCAFDLILMIFSEKEAIKEIYYKTKVTRYFQESVQITL